MKSIVAVVVLIVCISFTNGTGPFFGNKYWILLGQTKPGNHPGITIKEEVNVSINETRKVDRCLNSWIFTNGFMYFAQDGSLDLAGKNFTVGVYYYYTGPEAADDDLIILWESNDVYLSTFGAKPNGGFWHRFNSSSSLKPNTWVFVGFSVDASKNEVTGWVDDVVTKVSIGENPSNKDMMKGDIVIGKYGKSSSPSPRIELAGVTVMAGAIEETQIETFKTDIISTLTPTCPRSVGSGSRGLSRLPVATLITLVLIVGALSKLPN